MTELPKIDEFAFVLLAGVLLIFILAFAWTTPTEGTPILDATHLDLTASQGETRTLDFTIRGTTALTAINVTVGGDIAKWASVNKNDFDVAIGSSSTVTITLKVPRSATLGVYNGRINVKSQGGTGTFSISVNVVKERVKTSSRPISLGDFSVSYTKGTDVLDSKEDASVSTNALSERLMTLTGRITPEKLSITTGGSISIVVTDTNQDGNLIVIMNGTEIYNQKIDAGEVLIPLEKSQLASSNMITIKAGSPGWKFWSTAYYDIKSAEFSIDYEGAFAKTFDINMTKNEVENFKQFDLFFRVPQSGYKVPLAELMIKIDNQIVYWDIPPLSLFDMSFNEDMFGNPLYLTEGANTITFLFEEEAYYKMSDAMLTIEYYV